MFLKKYKPLNSSLRFRVNINKKSLNLQKFKRLFFKKKNNSGRNSFGHITVRHKGGGLFNLRRYVDFFRLKKTEGNFITYDIDKKYTSFLALIKYNDGSVAYNLASDDLKKNQRISTLFDTKINFPGITKPLG
jgi:large subunit ribosomal protein L2